MTQLRINLIDTVNDRRLSVTLPDDATAYSLRDTAYGKLGQHKQAKADLDWAFDLDPAIKTWPGVESLLSLL